jgi:hypothetical protein
MSERPSLNLTDSEWVKLIDGNSDDSELPVCCANVSALRDALMRIVRNGRSSPISAFDLPELRKTLGWYCSGHDMTPLLQKVADQVGFKPEDTHEPNSIEV